MEFNTHMLSVSSERVSLSSDKRVKMGQIKNICANFGTGCRVEQRVAGSPQDRATVVFLGQDPQQYWCRIPCASELSKHCAWTFEEEYNLTVLTSRWANYSSQCERYDLQCNSTCYGYTDSLFHLTNNTLGKVPFTTCQDGWLYEEPHSTIASEFDLVCENRWMIDMTQAVLNLGFLIGGFTLGYAADSMDSSFYFWLSSILHGFGGCITVNVSFALVTSPAPFDDDPVPETTNCLGVSQYKYGRIIIYLFSAFGAGLCGLIVAFAPNIIVFSIFRFLQGVFGKGTWMTSFVIVTEIVGSDERRIVGIVIQVFFTLGVIILPGIAYLISTWQWIQLITTLPNFLFLLYYWVIPESPRWLLTRKKGEKALKIMQSIAQDNGKCLPQNFSEITGCDHEISNPSLLDLVRTPQMRKITLILMYAWFTSAVVYQGLVLRLGIIEGNLYLEFFISALMELPAAFLILLTIDRIGRRPLFISSAIAAGVACLITAFLPKDVPWLITSVAILARLGITITFELVYLVNSELYPTVLRNFGVSLCSGLCDIGGIVAPFLLYRLADIWSELPLLIYCILAVLSGILVIFLPETKGLPLPETIQDVEQLSSRRRIFRKNKHPNSSTYV